MNDRPSDRCEGLMIALSVCEMHKKHPGKIEPQIVKLLRDVSVNIAEDAIDHIRTEVRIWEQMHLSKA